jgi:hypothetical protein
MTMALYTAASLEDIAKAIDRLAEIASADAIRVTVKRDRAHYSGQERAYRDCARILRGTEMKPAD